jgi:hypothetical protein
MKSRPKIPALSTTPRQWKLGYIVAIGLLACGPSLAEDFSNMVWMRTDEQRITGNAKLEQQDRDDRAACLKAVTPTESADMFKGCMAAKGYVMTTRPEAEARLIAAEAIRSGEACPEAVRTFYQGSAKPSWNAIWSVECKGGPSYSILIMSDEKGSSKVMTCGELRAVGGDECFVRND